MKKQKGRDYPLSPTPVLAAADNTSVRKVVPNLANAKRLDLVKKFELAKKLYKENPTEVFSDAVDRAKANLK